MLKHAATQTFGVLLSAAELFTDRTGKFCGRVATPSASYALLMTLFWCLFLAMVGALLFAFRGVLLCAGRLDLAEPPLHLSERAELRSPALFIHRPSKSPARRSKLRRYVQSARSNCRLW